MPVISEKKRAVKAIGKSWVIDLRDDFASENGLMSGTQVLITFKGKDQVSAEVLPPLSDEIAASANKIFKKRLAAYEELRRIGD